MKQYEITIKPSSGFGTSLKGDTLFGHFCWQAVYDPSLIKGGLTDQIKKYHEKPFAIFSSAFPIIQDGPKKSYVLKKPTYPMSKILGYSSNRHDNIIKAKKNKDKSWMLVNSDSIIDLKQVEFISEKKLFEIVSKQKQRQTFSSKFTLSYTQQHNSINRCTGTTGTGQFAPYTHENTIFMPGAELVIFVLFDLESTDIDNIVKGLTRIGAWGFGRDASTGMGRFDIIDVVQTETAIAGNINACYSLAPSVPEKKHFKKIYSKTFVRYGKHGDQLAKSKNPFKNPVVMADEASVFIPNNYDFFEKPYLGCGVTYVSKAMPETVVQGYSPYLPLNLGAI